MRLETKLARQRQLKTMACVCKHWASMARESCARTALRKFCLNSCLPSRALVLNARRELTLRRAYLKSLLITQQPPGFFTPVDVGLAGSTLTQANCQALGWDALLSLVPRLESLTIEESELTDLCTPEIIAAAADQCRSLQKLVLPMPNHRSRFAPMEQRARRLAVEIPRTLNATIAGLEAWQPRRLYGGIRELALPLYETDGPLSTPLMNSMLEAIIRWCPAIEVITGHDRVDVRRQLQQWVRAPFTGCRRLWLRLWFFR